MLTKQKVLFVTVRQTTKTKGCKGIGHKARFLQLVQCLRYWMNECSRYDSHNDGFPLQEQEMRLFL